MTTENPREAKALKVGDVAPDFALQGTDNRTVCLADRLTQHAVLLIFYRGHW